MSELAAARLPDTIVPRPAKPARDREPWASGNSMAKRWRTRCGGNQTRPLLTLWEKSEPPRGAGVVRHVSDSCWKSAPNGRCLQDRQSFMAHEGVLNGAASHLERLSEAVARHVCGGAHQR